MLTSLDGSELAEWEALYRIEPWGEQRADLQTALLAATIANQWRSGTPAQVKDFLPDFWGENKRGNLAKMLAIGQAFAASTRAASLRAERVK